MLYYCSGNEMFYATFWKSFPWVVTLFALNATICMVMARTVYDKTDLTRKFLLVGGGGLVLFAGQFPMMFRLYGCIFQDSHLCYKENMFYHFLAYFFSLFCALSFSLHLPEKAYPGRFDIFVTGHQLFHMGVNCGASTLSYAGYLDLKTMPRHVLELAQPDIHNIWLSFSIFNFINTNVLLRHIP